MKFNLQIDIIGRTITARSPDGHTFIFKVSAAEVPDISLLGTPKWNGKEPGNASLILLAAFAAARNKASSRGWM